MMPIAMMALSYSSVPIHRDYFKTNTSTSKILYKQSLIFLITVPACCIICALLALQYSFTSVILCLSIFFAEKCFDEKLRFLNYNKKMKKWEVTQLIRSVWLMPGLIIAINFEEKYELISSVSIATTVLIGLLLYRKKVSIFLTNNFQIENFHHLYKSSPYLVAALTIGTFRHLPKIIVTQYFEKFAHFFLIVAQATQVFPIIYNLFYQVPYRKMMSMKPKLYSRVMLDKNTKLSKVALLLVIISLSLTIASSIHIEIIILTVAVADAMFFSIITNYTGNLSWLMERTAILSYSLKYFILVIALQLIATYFILHLYPSDIELYIITLSLVATLIVKIIQNDLKHACS